MLTNCPICNASTSFFPYLTWKSHTWVRCPQCSGGHKVPYVPETEDDALMEHQYDGVYWEPAFYDRRLRFAENQAAWLREHYRPDMVLLEVGPGLGLGAKRFLELVPKYDTTGRRRAVAPLVGESLVIEEGNHRIEGRTG